MFGFAVWTQVSFLPCHTLLNRMKWHIIIPHYIPTRYVLQMWHTFPGYYLLLHNVRIRWKNIFPIIFLQINEKHGWTLCILAVNISECLFPTICLISLQIYDFLLYSTQICDNQYESVSITQGILAKIVTENHAKLFCIRKFLRMLRFARI